MRNIIKLLYGVGLGSAAGYLMLQLFEMIIGEAVGKSEWYLILILLGFPALGGLFGGIISIMEFEDDSLSDWILSLLTPIGTIIIGAIVAAILTAIITIIMLFITLVRTADPFDWVVLAFIAGLLGGGIYIIIIIFGG